MAVGLRLGVPAAERRGDPDLVAFAPRRFVCLLEGIGHAARGLEGGHFATNAFGRKRHKIGHRGCAQLASGQGRSVELAGGAGDRHCAGPGSEQVEPCDRGKCTDYYPYCDKSALSFHPCLLFGMIFYSVALANSSMYSASSLCILLCKIVLY